MDGPRASVRSLCGLSRDEDAEKQEERWSLQGNNERSCIGCQRSMFDRSFSDPLPLGIFQFSCRRASGFSMDDDNSYHLMISLEAAVISSKKGS